MRRVLYGEATQAFLKSSRPVDPAAPDAIRTIAMQGVLPRDTLDFSTLEPGAPIYCSERDEVFMRTGLEMIDRLGLPRVEEPEVTAHNILDGDDVLDGSLRADCVFYNHMYVPWNTKHARLNRFLYAVFTRHDYSDPRQHMLCRVSAKSHDPKNWEKGLLSSQAKAAINFCDADEYKSLPTSHLLQAPYAMAHSELIMVSTDHGFETHEHSMDVLLNETWAPGALLIGKQRAIFGPGV